MYSSSDNISVFEGVLVQIRDVIQDSEEFKNIPIYFDEMEMNPNVSLPAISFKVGSKKVTSFTATCPNYERQIEIRLHTKTVDKRELQSELYMYEEQLINVLNQAKLKSEFDFELDEVESLPIVGLMWNARKDGTARNNIFFSNLLRVVFTVRYII